MERTKDNFTALISKYKLPFGSGIVCGLIAYMSAFTNKFLNYDELEYLFSKGATLDSGRWMLALTSCIFPDVSMPWIYGVITVIFLSVAACVIIRTFEIKSRVLQAILAGIMVTFTVETYTLAYMFTAVPYALAVLMITVAIYYYLHGKKYKLIVCALLICAALGIYQAYISLSASLFVAYCIAKTFDAEWDWQRILRKGIECICVLICAIILYFAANKIIMTVTGTEYNTYADNAMTISGETIVQSILNAYRLFVICILRQQFLLVPNLFSTGFHVVLLTICTLIAAREIIQNMSSGKRVLSTVLCLCFPIAINCLVVVTSGWHQVEFYGFAVVYVLAAVVLDTEIGKRRGQLHDVGALCLAAIAVCCIFYSNKIYLKQKLVYEESYGYFQQISSMAKMLPEYTGKERLVFAGTPRNIYSVPEIDMYNVISIRNNLTSGYSRNRFLNNYLGYDIDVENMICTTYNTGFFPDDDLIEIYEAMPTFPADGSIMKIDDMILVKLH